METPLSFYNLVPYGLVGYLTLNNNHRQPIYKKYIKKEIRAQTFIIVSNTTDHYSLVKPDFEAYDRSLTPLHFHTYFVICHDGKTTFETYKPTYPQNINLLHYFTI